MKNTNKGIARFISAFGFSCQGLKKAYVEDTAFRQEVWLLAVAVIVTFFLDITGFEKGLLIISILFVMVIELLNSGIEALADKITEEFDPLIGKAKDVCSAAVLLSLVMAVICWVAILF